MIKKIVVLMALALLPLSASALDINGTVSRDDGEPVCALVLANGQSMFSCTPNPKGEFAFTGLPERQAEPGVVTVQVFATGFQPYKSKFDATETPSVVLQRADTSPVRVIDDGLSDETLEGTYELLRVTLIYNDGLLVDSTDPRLIVNGTMEISADTLRQTINIEIDGQGAGGTITAGYDDFGHYVISRNQSTGGMGLLAVVERGDKFVTAVNGNVFGGDYTEINYWKRVTDETAEQTHSTSSVKQLYAPISGFPGVLTGELSASSGLK